MGNALAAKVNTEQIQKEVTSHQVVVYSKPSCGFCTRAKSLLAEEHIDYYQVDLNAVEKQDPSGFQSYVNGLVATTKQTSVPQIFICGQFIGGFAELKSLQEKGRLHATVDQCPPIDSLHK
uniref:Glutaredoxin domain-containing protein n=1 Tax=Plectus sambesii TaxID=2011161 RepID=A0A914V3Q9_9BILA